MNLYAVRLFAFSVAVTACQGTPSRSTVASGGSTLTAPIPSSSSTTSAAVSPAPPAAPADGIRDASDCPEGMVFIPAGTFSWTGPVFGSADEKPVQQQQVLKAFCMDKTEVGRRPFEHGECGREDFQCVQNNYVATCVTHEQAECYCAHVSPRVHGRLPTQAEWLYAALGTDGRRLPWGNAPFPPGEAKRTADFCSQEPGNIPTEDIFCTPSRNTRDVGPFGVLGMATNGYEMTATCPEKASGCRSCAVYGIDHRDGPELNLLEVTLTQPICDRFDQGKPTVGFRCVASVRVVAEP